MADILPSDILPGHNLAALILAGGQSSRMGADKAFLDWEGAPLLKRQLAVARAAGADTVWIAGRRAVDYSAFGCPVVHDPVENAGPLAGLVAGLRTVRDSHVWLMVLAVDLPRMSSDYLAKLAAEAAATGLGVIPRRGPYFEPLAAVYPIAPALAQAEAQLAARRLALQDLATSLIAQGAVRPRPIAPMEQPLFANWNDGAGPRPATSCR